ncbi:restriction endonuclease subunit S [Cobetia sp. SIMBA_158]|uniref:restriction endonuclease subunit S n=2 Tax=Gammaproteobacteria TaxID=1236 RepID=UPI003981916E
MSDRKSIQLGDYANVLSGFPFPSEGFSQEEGVPLIRIRDLLASELETYFIGPYPDNFVIDDGNILIGMDGDFNIVRWTKGKALLNQRVCKVFTSAAELDNGYLFWLLEPKLQDIHQKTPQTTVKHLSVRDLVQLRLEIPPVNEQRLIARILDTLDTQIEKTEALIAKLEKVKEGLLHDLLTRGIDENGQLRPSPQQAPELYKESPLGLIPREWACVSIGEIARSTTLGTASRGAESSAKTKLIKMGNLNWGNTLSLTDVENISDRKVHENLFLNDADLLFNTRNTPELVGKTCSWKGDGSSFTFDNNILRIRFSKGLNGHFVASYMSGDIGRGRIGRLATGTTSVAAIYWRSLSRLEVPVPSPREQQLIVDKIKSSQNNTNTLNDDLTSLKRLKAGLMDDLLTGHVRTTSMLEHFKEVTSA